jgi:3D (Asp-Asp-Asp) domain-containing protein
MESTPSNVRAGSSPQTSTAALSSTSTKAAGSSVKPQTTKPASKIKPAPKLPVSKPKPKTVAAKPSSSTVIQASTRRSGRSFFLKSTGYNSSVSQTDSTPRVTATGARTRFGVIALSRDMLGSIPYGSQVTIEDMGVLGSGAGRGRFNGMLRGVVFIVEDTMNPRISRTVDIWFHSRRTALSWGKRQVKLTILRSGRR